MKQLTRLVLLASVLCVLPVHSEETASSSMPSLALPAPIGGSDPSAELSAPLTGQSAAAQVMSNVITINVGQMGQPHGIVLSGGQLQGGINFTLPMDQVITNAQLSLNVKVSPAMAARNATMLLMMNGQPLGSLPLNATDTDITRFQLEVPAALLVSSNNINFRIDDSDALQCQRDLTDKYRVTIMPDSQFSLEGQPLDIGSDLSLFPRPFFDAMQMTPAAIAFVFQEKPASDSVSAAALISSWIGMQAAYRGVTFTAMNGRLPEKNGIVIGHPGEQVGGLTLPQTNDPMLKIIDNPVNPGYKLLLVIGKDDKALQAAAWRLTRGNFAPQTADMAVTPQAIPVSQPYDAPHWIPTDRPVKLSELLDKDQSLTVNGLWHEQLRLAFRAAPDLFLWDGETIPLHIGYRFPTESWIDEDKSYLNMTLNNTFLEKLPVNKQGAVATLWHKAGGDTRQETVDMALEPYLIYGDNQLGMYFNIVPKADAPCSALLNNNIKSRVDGESTIDLSHTRHFALLPNLSYFVGASFPFSRIADYSQTVLLLPDNPSETHITTLLGLAARSGYATGTPLNHNRVVMGIPAGGASLEFLRNRDVLAVTSMEQHTFTQSLMAGSPFVANGNAFNVREPDRLQKTLRWLAGDWTSDGLDADRYLSSSEAWRGFVSFRSTWNADRLVVVAIGSNDEQLSRLHHDLTLPAINAGIRGDAAIITNDNSVRSFRVGEQFPRGELPPYMMIIWYANQHAALLAFFGLLFGTLLGLVLYVVLQKRARERLAPQSKK